MRHFLLVACWLLLPATAVAVPAGDSLDQNAATLVGTASDEAAPAGSDVPLPPAFPAAGDGAFRLQPLLLSTGAGLPAYDAFSAEAAVDEPPPGPNVPRAVLGAAVAAPVHLATVAAVLATACQGTEPEKSCSDQSGIEGAPLVTALILLPPAVSGLTAWAIGSDGDAPSSLPWTMVGGLAGQTAGIGLALASGSPVVGVLSLTLLPAAGELAALLLTASPPKAQEWQSSGPPERLEAQAVPTGFGFTF